MNAIEYYLLYSNAQRTCFAFAAGYVEGRQWGSHFRPWQGIVEIVLSCWKVYLNLHDQHYNVNTKHASHVSLIQMLLTRFQRIVLLVFISVSSLTRNFIWIPIQWMDHVFITASSQTGYLIWTGMYRKNQHLKVLFHLKNDWFFPLTFTCSRPFRRRTPSSPVENCMYSPFIYDIPLNALYIY